MCKPLQAVLHLDKGGRKKGHAWRLVNIGRIMGHWGHTVANAMERATTRKLCSPYRYGLVVHTSKKIPVA